MNTVLRYKEEEGKKKKSLKKKKGKGKGVLFPRKKKGEWDRASAYLGGKEGKECSGLGGRRRGEKKG